jgi:phospholipase/carboxylesterase
MTASIEVQRPVNAERLILLFHGVGASAGAMLPLAQAIAKAQPTAAVISVMSPDLSDLGQGYQWFSVRGITEDNRMARVDEAMPRFIACIQDWQAKTGIDPEYTTLIGFSQGTIMALESARQPTLLARRIIGLSGRFAVVPVAVAHKIMINLIHGRADPVIAADFATLAYESLRALGVVATLDLVPGLGHQIDEQVARLVLDRLDS